ncbi:MAG: acyl-CoA dehydrogenase [Janthinobacterium lividum]
MTAVISPSAEERDMLRESLRGFLAANWPAAAAVERAKQPDAVRRLWQQLAEQGIAALGTEPAEGGLYEIVIAMEELGRAAAPAPMLGAIAFNLLLWAKRAEASAIASLGTALHAGKACISVALGRADHDANAGAARLVQGKLDGKLAFVEGISSATHFLVFIEQAASAADGPTLAIVERAAAGVQVLETTTLGSGGMGELHLENVEAVLVEVTRDEIDDLNRVLRVGLTARALGAADQAFEMVVDYAKLRKQFGRLIGSFQAIQHKLANCLISLQGVRAIVHGAAASFDSDAGNWRLSASAAYTQANLVLRQVSLETHHAFGAVGYSEEHEAPRHFRRVHLDLLRHGGGRRGRAELAAFILDQDEGALPEYDLGEAGNNFRKEVRAWLDENWTDERRDAQQRLPIKERDYNWEFMRDIGRTGWLAMSWPESFGGQNRTPFEQLAYFEEIERAEAPRAGAPIQSAAFMVYGTPEQQQKFLPGIKDGTMMFGLGYSEPDSGSDLASVRTRAERDGDAWVINGQKIWTTTWWANYMWLATRTDPDAKPRHAGLSVFAVPMDTPGITIKTTETMYSGTFANIFYDNVRLPASALVGEVNGGWDVITNALSTERGYIGGVIVSKITHMFELLCDYIRHTEVDGRLLKDDPLVRDRIGGLAAEIEVGRQMAIHCVSMVEGGKTPKHEASICKVYSGELMERFYEAAIELLGMRATLSEDAPAAIIKGRLEQKLRHSLMWVISIGTNEIQRTLIAQQGLGLPKA